MQVQIAIAWQVEHPLRDDAPVGNDKNRIRLDRLQFVTEIVVSLDPLRL